MHTILTFEEKKDFNKVITNNDIYFYLNICNKKLKRSTINNKWQTIQYAQYTYYLQDTNSWWLDEILTSLWSQGNFALFCIIFFKIYLLGDLCFMLQCSWSSSGFQDSLQNIGFCIVVVACLNIGFELALNFILSLSSSNLQNVLNAWNVFSYLYVTWQTLFCHWLLWMSSTGTESVSLQPQCSQQCLGLGQFLNLHMHVEIMKSVKIGEAKIDLLSDSCHIM